MQAKPTVGFSTAFTGKYQASKLIIRFLEILNVNVVKSTTTKPSMVEAGTTLASAEFCLPLRVYVGHIYTLLQEHPEIDYLLTPIIKGEHPSSSTCAKYRDLDGVVIRSLGSITGYHIKMNKSTDIDKVNTILGKELTEKLVTKTKDLPRIIAPEIESLNKNHLRQVCFKVYAELFNISSLKKMRLLLNSNFNNSFDSDLQEVSNAFEQAYIEVIETTSNKYERLLSNPKKIRLAILGRSYMVEDPTLTADVKAYFVKKGVSVLTLQDVPFKFIKEKYQQVNGFYDYHKTAQAFIDTVIDQVDGFIIVGSFGCHPDAFQMEYFAKHITRLGKSCWTFKFDEQTGGTGFHTRFETILGFLEKKRDERINGLSQQVINHNGVTDNLLIKETQSSNKPIFIWPYMGHGINLIVKETWHQLGLENFMYAPNSINEETITKGDTNYTETCSPFALYLGSLRDTLNNLLDELKNEADKKQIAVEPRRIIILMAGGKGPCTFGWYALSGEELLQEEYGERLKQYGHSIEMISIDNQGRNLLNFLQELATVAENNKLHQIMGGLETLQNNNSSKLVKTKLELQLLKLLKDIVWPGWKKLLAYEDIQNKALKVRAHELVRGDTTKCLKKWINQLDNTHTLTGIEDVKKIAFLDLENIKQDQLVKPKVVVVGEIYVTSTSFANRGAVDNLLGYLGVEAIEGMGLSHFIIGSFKGLKYHLLYNQAFIKPLVDLLEGKGLYNTNAWVRDPIAKPFLEHEIGGDGQPTVASARKHIEEDGVDGILHIYPFKCMPEGIAKDALIEMSQLYGVKSLHLSFSKETEIERLKTELGTFATLLHQDLEKKEKKDSWLEDEIKRRKKIGQVVEELYYQSKRKSRPKLQFNFSKLPKKLAEETKK